MDTVQGSSAVSCVSFRLEMRVDEEDVGVAQSPFSLVPAPGQNILLGKAFQGCLTNLYMRRSFNYLQIYFCSTVLVLGYRGSTLGIVHKCIRTFLHSLHEVMPSCEFI